MEKMNTVILMWNPAISSYKLEQLNHEIAEFPDCWYNWSVWEHDKAQRGDRFYLVRVGHGNTGVVMSGYFSSDPYQDEDWSGRGRVTYYMDMEPDHILHPDKTPILTTAELAQAVPDFDWTGGHSGRVLTDEQALALEKRWHEFLDSVPAEVYDHERAVRQDSITIEQAVELAVNAHRGQKDLDGNPEILHPLAVGLAGRNRQEVIAGLLHDVVEDSDYTFGDLLMHGVDEDIVDALRLLTHDKQTMTYDQYVQRIIQSGNQLALHTKLADLRHNLQRGRAGGHLEQVAKHERALTMIEAALKQQ